MYRFTYPAEGYDELNLNKGAIRDLIKRHFGMAARLLQCQDYYEGRHAILSRTRTDDDSTDVKIVCNHAKDITDTASGYFMGKPITYSDSTGEHEVALDTLLEAFDAAEIDWIDADLAHDASIFGAAYEYVYAKEGESTPTSKALSPIHTFIVVDDSIEETPLFAVYYYPLKDDTRNEMNWVATVCTKNYIYRMSIDGSAKSEDLRLTEAPEPHYFGDIPVIEYLNNHEGQGDFEQQIPLIDAYNTLMSDRVVDKEQFIDAILVLYGTQLGDSEDETEEAHQRLYEKKLLELPDAAKAEYLTRSLDETGVEVLRKALKEDIYTFSHVPNLSDENFAGNSSGVAMEYKLLGLEMLTNIKERYFRKGLKRRIELYSTFLGAKGLQTIAGSVIATFSRSLPKNLQELAQTVSMLSDTVSKRTLLKQIPFVEDPDYELEELAQDRAEGAELQRQIFGAAANTPLTEEAEEEPKTAAEKADVKEAEQMEE